MVSELVSEGISTTLFLIGWALVFAFFIGIGWYVWMITTYKIKFRIRKVTGTHNIIYDDKAKVVRIGKKGKSVIKWRLQKLKQNAPIPPDEAISIDKKGKMVVDAYYTEQGEFKYILPKRSVPSLEPLSSDDKTFYAEEFKDSLKYKGTDWSGVIMMVTQGVILITVLVLALVFVSSIVEPADIIADKLIMAVESAKSCQAIIPLNAP